MSSRPRRRGLDHGEPGRPRRLFLRNDEFHQTVHPYETVTLTASRRSRDEFRLLDLQGSHYSDALSITLPVDFDHTVAANYFLPLPEAIDNSLLSMVTSGVQAAGWVRWHVSYRRDAAQSKDAADSQSGTMQTSVRGPAL